MDLDKLKKDCDITKFRSSGPGGQHKNVTDSAVRLKHRPTGIVVIGRRHRSQHRNLQDALERLAEKLKERRVQLQAKKRIGTKKSRSVREKELVQKRKRSDIKTLRKKITEE